MAASITAPAQNTELKANVAQSVTVTGDDGAYDLVIGDAVRGTLTVSGGTGAGDLTPTADDIGATEIAVRDSGQGADLDTLTVTAVRWRYAFEFFTPEDVLWYVSPRVNVTLNGDDIAELGALDGNGDDLAAKNIAQETDAAQLRYLADDWDFAGMPSAFADSGTQWMFNNDATGNALPVCRIAVARPGTEELTSYMLGSAVSNASGIIKNSSGNAGLYNGVAYDAGFPADASQPGIWIGVFDGLASALRVKQRDGTDRAGDPGNAGGANQTGNAWGARRPSGTGAANNINTKIHEEVTLSAIPSHEQIEAYLADWATRPGWLAAPLPTTTFGEPVKAVDSDRYTAHPYGMMNYDAARDKAFMMYNERTTHTGTGDGSVWYVEINTDTGALGTPVELIATTSQPSPRCLCAGVTAQGDYLAIVKMHINVTPHIDHLLQLRSTDGGANWANEGELLDADDEIFTETQGSGAAHSMFRTLSGTLLCGYRNTIAQQTDVIRSTDNGAHWELITCDNGDIPNTEPLEPAFWQHPITGRIVMVIRPGNNGNISERLFSYSDDDGQTFAPFVISPGHEMYYNPACIVYHEDLEIVEMFMGSRASHPDDGLGSIYRVVATPDQAARNIWSTPERLFTMAPQAAGGPHAGYPAVARAGKKVFLAWYDGHEEDCDIWMAVGEAPVAPGSMSGTVQCSAALSGSLTGLGNMSGSVAADATLAGMLTAYGNMAGTIDAGASLSGALDGVVGYEIPADHPRVSTVAAESRWSVAK